MTVGAVPNHEHQGLFKLLAHIQESFWKEPASFQLVDDGYPSWMQDSHKWERETATALHCKRLEEGYRIVKDLKACSKNQNLERGKAIHNETLEGGHVINAYVTSSLINMYAKCGSMVNAQLVFDRARHPNVVSWTSLIMGYVEHGQAQTSLELFRKMRNGGPAPNAKTLVAALKACISLVEEGGPAERGQCKNYGNEIYELAKKLGCSSNIYLQSTLMDLYSKCNSMVDAQILFDGMRNPSVVSWNVLIMGYVDNGQALKGLRLFNKMVNEEHVIDSRTFVAVLKACTVLVVQEGSDEWRETAEGIHRLAVENGCNSDRFVQNSLINLYAKCNCMTEARQVFEGMQHRNVVSWTALIMGYVEDGNSLTALDLFMKMKTLGLVLDPVTLSCALKACALLGALEFGRSIHVDINRGNRLDVVLVTGLVDFYAKCGSLEEAQSVFDLHAETRDEVTWSALLGGFSSCGDAMTAFRLFQRMQDSGFRPSSITFVSMLSCCSHAGLVDKGKECFEAMVSKYDIVPAVEHYACMVDMLGRCNMLDDAMALLQDMSCKPNEVIWMSILSASSRRGSNLEIGRMAFQSLVRMHNHDPATYVLMGKIYESKDMLHEQKMVLGMTLNAHKTKSKESSWTNEVGCVHTFFG